MSQENNNNNHIVKLRIRYVSDDIKEKLNQLTEKQRKFLMENTNNFYLHQLNSMCENDQEEDLEHIESEILSNNNEEEVENSQLDNREQQDEIQDSDGNNEIWNFSASNVIKKVLICGENDDVEIQVYEDLINNSSPNNRKKLLISRSAFDLLKTCIHNMEQDETNSHYKNFFNNISSGYKLKNKLISDMISDMHKFRLFF